MKPIALSITRRQIDGISVTVERKRIKALRLRVLPPAGDVRVSCPVGVPESAVLSFVREKRQWILSARARLAALPPPLGSVPADGEPFFVGGAAYRTVHRAGTRFSVTLSDGVCTLTHPAHLPAAAVGEHLREWYRAHLAARLSAEVPRLSRLTGLSPAGWRIRDMKTRWGVCNTRTRVLTFRLELARYSDRCLSYVVLHELAHLHCPGHGPDFYRFIGQYDPLWRAAVSELKGPPGGAAAKKET